MQDSDSEALSEEFVRRVDPDLSRAKTNYRAQRDDKYATDPNSTVHGTPQKKFDEEDGLSDGSEFHTPDQRLSGHCLNMIGRLFTNNRRHF